MIKVYALAEYSTINGYNACSHIRVINPLKQLEQQGKIDLTLIQHWNGEHDCDVVYVQRSWRNDICLDDAIRLTKSCREHGIKLIYELDDNLLEAPMMERALKLVVQHLAKNADLLIVSTDELKRRMVALNQRTIVVPNMLSKQQVDSFLKRKRRSEKISIGYMGTFTHQEDFQMILFPLIRVLTKYSSQVNLELIGAVSNLGLLGQLPNVKVTHLEGRSTYPEFWSQIMSNIEWDIGLAPLKVNAFTRCKSDIKFLDYAAVHCCGVFSEHPAYQNTVLDGINGKLVKNEPDCWFNALESLILNVSERERMATCATTYLMENRLIEQNVALWEQAIKSCLEQ